MTINAQFICFEACSNKSLLLIQTLIIFIFSFSGPYSEKLTKRPTVPYSHLNNFTMFSSYSNCNIDGGRRKERLERG